MEWLWLTDGIAKKGLRKSIVPEETLCCIISSDLFERVQKEETDNVATMTDSTSKNKRWPLREE